ncbi:hypothetical protein FJZ36_03560 [Candidatus Poribacteria bacterium]|nr:hypothetical protein [Candidatus Poribacteria bacterium]
MSRTRRGHGGCVSLIALVALAAITGHAEASTQEAFAMDYGSLQLTGTGTDTFAECVQAAAQLLGVEADYGEISALSGACFAPRINLREDCTAWWHRDPRDEGIADVAARFGLRYRWLDAPDCSWDDSDEIKARTMQARARAIRDAMNQGEVVLTSPWQKTADGGFVPWLWYGIVVEAREDGTVLGLSHNGRRDNVPYPWGKLFALSKGDVTLAPHDADRQALRAATAAIDGSREPFLPTKDVVYGVRAVSAWIDAMEHTPFCEPCFKSAPDRVWSCADDNARDLVDRSKTAAAYLRSRADAFAEASRPRLERAAERYERIVELLIPVLARDDETGYERLIGDAATQHDHAATLRQVMAELGGVASDLNWALSQDNMRQEGDAIRIDGVLHPRFPSKMCTFAGALEAALAPTAYPYSYTYLMGVTGLAFRVRGWKGDGKGWCPSTPVGEFPEEISAASSGTGWRLTNIRASDWSAPAMERFADMVIASINSGSPVTGYVTGDLNCGVAYGHADGGKMILVHGYFDKEEHRRIPAASMGPTLIFTPEFLGAPSRRDALLQAMRIAVHSWRRGISGSYWYGDAAYREWIRELRILDRVEFTDQERANMRHGYMWAFETLWDARREASKFLREYADALGEDHVAALREASDLYQKEFDLLDALLNREESRFHRFHGVDASGWTTEGLQPEIEGLEAAREIEARAIRLLESVLRQVAD